MLTKCPRNLWGTTLGWRGHWVSYVLPRVHKMSKHPWKHSWLITGGLIRWKLGQGLPGAIRTPLVISTLIKHFPCLSTNIEIYHLSLRIIFMLGLFATISIHWFIILQLICTHSQNSTNQKDYINTPRTYPARPHPTARWDTSSYYSPVWCLGWTLTKGGLMLSRVWLMLGLAGRMGLRGKQ